MKLRKGFVSNSSSAAFIIRASAECNTVSDLAKEMLLSRGWENDNAVVAILKKHIQQGIDPDTPMAFSTTNYPTYIVPVMVDGVKYFAVNTCNNVDWYLPGMLFQNLPGVWEATGVSPEEAQYEEPDIKSTCFFLWIESGIIGKYPETNEGFLGCPNKHWSPIWESQDGDLICSSCGAGAIPRSEIRR